MAKIIFLKKIPTFELENTIKSVRRTICILSINSAKYLATYHHLN